MDAKPLRIDYARKGGMPDAGLMVPKRSWWIELLDALWSVPAWALFALVVIAVPLGALEQLGGPVLGYPCLILSIVLIPTLAITARSIRRRRGTAVLGYLQQAFRLNLPLERFLGAAARSERHPVSGRLLKLRTLLEGGRTLADALMAAVPEVPERAVALIGHAEQTGNVPQTLDRLMAEQVDVSRRPRQDRALEVWYPPLLLLLVGALIFLMSQLLFDQYNGLLAGFHLKLPAFSAWVFNSIDWAWPAFAVLFCILIGASGMKLRETIRQTRPNWLWREIKARVLWCVPLVHALLYDRALADLCTALADSVESVRPMEQALLGAQKLELHPFVQRRAARWGEALAAGRPIDQAARSAGLPALLAGMLNPSAGGASLGEALRFLARFYSDRSIVRGEVARGVYLPAVTIIMGILVAGVAIGLYLPLVRLELSMGGK